MEEMTRLSLASVIKAELMKSGSSVPQLADKLNVTKALVQGCLCRNSFVVSDLLKILKVVRISFVDINDLQRRYKFKLATPRRRQKMSSSHMANYTAEIFSEPLTTDDLLQLGKVREVLGERFTVKLALEVIRSLHIASSTR